MRRILVTNDDGYFSPGIEALAAALAPLGEVTIVAPQTEASAVGHALTLRRPLRLEHIRDTSGDYWEVRGKDGLLTRSGTPRPQNADPGWRDAAVAGDPGQGRHGRVFAWRITETVDVFGNLNR